MNVPLDGEGEAPGLHLGEDDLPAPAGDVRQEGVHGGDGVQGDAGLVLEGLKGLGEVVLLAKLEDNLEGGGGERLLGGEGAAGGGGRRGGAGELMGGKTYLNDIVSLDF